MVAAAIIGGGALSAIGTTVAASSAADAQTAAAEKSAQTQLGMFNKTQQNLAPFISGGQGAFNMLTGRLPELTQTFNPTMSWLENTPGYKFSLDQGLKSVQNGYAAKGLGSSGAAMKGATDYATGLAGTTFQQQFQNFLQSNLQNYNMLAGASGIGANAAAGLGSQSTAVGANVGNAYVGAGNAQAGADMAIGKSFGNAVGTIPSAMMWNSLYGGAGNAAPGAPLNLLAAGGGAAYSPNFGGIF